MPSATRPASGSEAEARHRRARRLLRRGDGQVKWEKRFNVFHTDIVTNRLGWAPLTADPDNKLIFAHIDRWPVCRLRCGNRQDRLGALAHRGVRPGDRLRRPRRRWADLRFGPRHRRHRQRELGATTPRAPIGWSPSTRRPATSSGGRRRPVSFSGTYYSNPVVAVIDGQRLMITGGADGAMHAFQVRTGKRVWSYHIAAGVDQSVPGRRWQPRLHRPRRREPRAAGHRPGRSAWTRAR